jgi:hypothetical protein
MPSGSSIHISIRSQGSAAGSRMAKEVVVIEIPSELQRRDQAPLARSEDDDMPGSAFQMELTWRRTW